MSRVRDLLLPAVGSAVDKWAPILKQMVREINAALGVLVSASPVIGPRQRLNLLNGGNMTITAVDNPAEDAIDITLASSGGGGGISDGDKGDIVVSSSGTVWTVDNNAITAAKIAAGAVDTSELAANAADNTKLADVADATIKGRTLGAGSGDPQDLDADDVLEIVRTAAGWAQGFYGDGSDGIVTVNAPLILTRNMHYEHLTVESGGSIRTDGWIIAATDGVVIDSGGEIHNRGNNGATPAGGASLFNGAFLVATNSGGAGSGNTVGGVGNGPPRRTGGTGGAGGAGPSGAGGAAAPETVTKLPFPYCMLRSVTVAGVATPVGCGSGGGGGGADGAGPGTGGGGGSGGGMVMICSPTIENNGAIDVSAGDGGNAAASGSAGGGGGGGGGVVLTLCRDFIGTPPDVSAGAGGTGFGTGAGGTAGSAGRWDDLRL